MYDQEMRKSFLKEQGFEPRTTAWRPDVAAEEYRNVLEAERYEEGVRYQCIIASSVLHFEPREDVPTETQIIFGEIFRVYDIDKETGYAWGELETDGYVGFVRLTDIREGVVEPTHWVSAPLTCVFPAPDRKVEPHMFLPLNSRVTIFETSTEDSIYVRIGEGMWVFKGDLRALGDWFSDPLTPVLPFANSSSYLWGHRDGMGYDCSGLTQAGWLAMGKSCHRDADQQEHDVELGDPVSFSGDFSRLQKYDQVYWLGHLAIMVSDTHAIHAKGSEVRRVVIEAIVDINTWRLAEYGEGIRSVKRLAELA